MIELKKIIVEGRYDAITTQLSRELINAIKSKSKKGEIEFDFPVKRKISFDYFDDFEFTPEMTLSYNIKYDPKFKMGFDIYGQADDESIELELIVNPINVRNIYSEIIPILKDAIRHEIEHIAQNILNRPESEKFEKIPQDDFFRYLTAKHEIPAFVRGLYKGAKTKKITMGKAIDNFLSEYSERLTKNESEKVRDIWTAYAKKHLPASQW